MKKEHKDVTWVCILFLVAVVSIGSLILLSGCPVKTADVKGVQINVIPQDNVRKERRRESHYRRPPQRRRASPRKQDCRLTYEGRVCR